MIVNLQKHFCFSRNSESYDVDYLFTNKKAGDTVTGLYLTLNISINGADKKIHTISKPTSILYHSNEEIEHIIQEDTVAL